jgi:hypothetical protein
MRSFTSSAVCALAVAAAIVGCRPDPSRVAPHRDAGTRVTAVASQPPRTDHTNAPSFRRHIVPVLMRHCASASDCRGEEPTDSVSLDVRAAAAYRELVNRR